MSKFYAWNITNLFSVFSSIAVNKDFDLSAQNSQSQSDILKLERNDYIISIKNNSEIFGILKVVKTDGEKIKFNKEFETSAILETNSFDMNIPEDRIVEITEDVFNKIVDNLKGNKTQKEKRYKKISKPHNRIIFGAPGTGKSHSLELDRKNNFADDCFERVTFHPNYSYAQFVGTYKPITKIVGNKEEIVYEYVPGPFMRIFVNAVKEQMRVKSEGEESRNVLLLIEEINRANVAAVFGDVFQLLDRKSDGTSEYPIATSEDLRKFLAKSENLGGNPDDYKTLSIPSNMYIWATMNSADQGVFPMDTAFKRRWEFEYIGIDDGEKKAEGTVDETFASYTLPIPSKQDNDIKYIPIKWNVIRHAINNKLKEISGVNEDKLLGPYFLSKALLEKSTKVSAEDDNEEKAKICSTFKSKVLMYLYEDVVKMNPTELFNEEIFPDGKPLHYSDLCLKFDEVGLEIFGKDFIEKT